MGVQMSLLGSAESKKVFGEIFGSFWNIMMEENLGGLGCFPFFLTVYISYMLIYPPPITVV